MGKEEDIHCLNCNKFLDSVILEYCCSGLSNECMCMGYPVNIDPYCNKECRNEHHKQLREYEKTKRDL